MSNKLRTQQQHISSRGCLLTNRRNWRYLSLSSMMFFSAAICWLFIARLKHTTMSNNMSTNLLRFDRTFIHMCKRMPVFYFGSKLIFRPNCHTNADIFGNSRTSSLVGFVLRAKNLIWLIYYFLRLSLQPAELTQYVAQVWSWVLFLQWREARQHQ